jgi:acetamidase/formamidase
MINVRRFTAETTSHTFGGSEPIAELRSGDVLTIDTEDCFGGKVTGPGTLPSQVCDLNTVNPVTGPFWVHDAAPGDTLAIHIVAMRPSRDWAVSATFPNFGALTSSHATAMLHDPLPELVWRYELDQQAGTALFCSTDGTTRMPLPMAPMLGTIGVAPAGGQVISTLHQGEWGGNLDSPLIQAGSTVYLGVTAPGALFAIGDGHALQGEGEAGGVAVECAMTTTVAIEVIKAVPTPWPRVESASHLSVIGVARPLEDAYRIAHTSMTHWLRELTGMGLLDCAQLLAQAGRAPIGNVCDPGYTLAAQFPKQFLAAKAPAAYAGAHGRLATASLQHA